MIRLSANEDIKGADVRAFAESAGVLGFDRKQTREFLARVAARLEELESAVADVRGKEEAIVQALVAATASAESIERQATARAAEIEQEATARAAAMEREASMRASMLEQEAAERAAALDQEAEAARGRIAQSLERAGLELRTLMASLGHPSSKAEEIALDEQLLRLEQRSA